MDFLTDREQSAGRRDIWSPPVKNKIQEEMQKNHKRERNIGNYLILFCIIGLNQILFRDYEYLK